MRVLCITTRYIPCPLGKDAGEREDVSRKGHVLWVDGVDRHHVNIRVPEASPWSPIRIRSRRRGWVQRPQGALTWFSHLQTLCISEATEVHENNVKPIASFLAKSFPDLEQCGVVPLRTHTPHTETDYEDLDSRTGKDWQDWHAVWKELERIKGRTIFTVDVCSQLL
jgi:hypothetical protein